MQRVSAGVANAHVLLLVENVILMFVETVGLGEHISLNQFEIPDDEIWTVENDAQTQANVSNGL